MAAPVRPSRTAVTWAPGNYTSGPYTGSPARVAPPNPVLIPGNLATAEYINYGLGNASDDVAELQASAKAMYDARLSGAMANWGAATAIAGVGGYSIYKWNPITSSWFAAVSTGASASAIYESFDDGQTWINITSLGSLLAGIGVNQTSGDVLFLPQKSGGSSLLYSLSGRTASTVSGTSTSWTQPDSEVMWMLFEGSVDFFAYAQVFGSSIGIFETNSVGGSPSQVFSPTWAPITSPIKFASTGADSANMAICISMAPTTALSYALRYQHGSWSSCTFPYGTGNATGVTWDTTRQLFFASMAQSSGIGSIILSSPDGVTWTTVSSQAVFNIRDLRAGNANMGGVLMALGATGFGNVRPVYSVDGGVTWSLAATATSPEGTNPTSYPLGAQVHMGGNRFCIENAGTLHVGQALASIGAPTASMF